MIAVLAAAHGETGSASGLSITVSISRKWALDGSGPLFFGISPSVFDLDEVGTGCDLAVDMHRALG
jgi:hypothetical protein